MSEGRKLDLRHAMRFILAGKATLTLRNSETGNRYTYRVRAPKDQRDDKPVFFVGLLQGPDNEAHYGYMGTIFGKGADARFRHTAKSKVSESAPSFRAFQFVFNRLARNESLPETVEVWHEGACGRCGRKLTVPESIVTGFGPECSDVLGIQRAVLRPLGPVGSDYGIEPGDPPDLRTCDICGAAITNGNDCRKCGGPLPGEERAS